MKLNVRDVKQRHEAAHVYAEAFLTDPLFLHFLKSIPEAEHRPAMHKLMRFFVWSLGVSFDMCDVIRSQDGKAQSCALWEPHAPTCMGLLRIIRMIASFYYTFPSPKGWEAVQLFQTFDEKRAKLAPKPHYHLQLLGTLPDQQKRGYGTSAITEGMRRADEKGYACYLESSNPVNVPFYEKLGFVVVEEYQICPGGPVVHFMLRKPPAK